MLHAGVRKPPRVGDFSSITSLHWPGQVARAALVCSRDPDDLVGGCWARRGGSQETLLRVLEFHRILPLLLRARVPLGHVVPPNRPSCPVFKAAQV